MAELPDVSGGDTVASGFTNQVKNRTTMRYASAAARDASIPVPVSGEVAWLVDVALVTVYNGAEWDSVGRDKLPATVELNDVSLTLVSPINTNERIGLLSNIDTVNYKWMFVVTGTIEAAISSPTTWEFRLRELQPSTSNMQIVDVRDSVGEAVYRAPVSLHSLSFTGTTANEIELVVQRQSSGGTQVMRGFNISAVPVRRL